MVRIRAHGYKRKPVKLGLFISRIDTHKEGLFTFSPMKWENDWPIVGLDYDTNGIGDLSRIIEPDVGKVFPIETFPDGR